MIGCSGVVACLGVVSRLNFGVGGLPVGKLGVKTESGSGFASPREGAVNTLEEIMEMMGVIVFMYGLLVYIREWQQKINIEIKIII